MILIIDDDSAVRSSLSFMLKRAGYEAQTVSGPPGSYGGGAFRSTGFNLNGYELHPFYYR